MYLYQQVLINITVRHVFSIRHLDTRRKLGRVDFRKDFWDCY